MCEQRQKGGKGQVMVGFGDAEESNRGGTVREGDWRKRLRRDEWSDGRRL